VIFQVLTVASMKLTAFWDIVLCCVSEVDRSFRDVYHLIHGGSKSYHPDDGGSTHPPHISICMSEVDAQGDQ
jgi:hypothetical protein